MITNNQYELDKALISIKREKQTVLKWLMRGITEQKRKWDNKNKYCNDYNIQIIGSHILSFFWYWIS